jgi:ABC-3C biological conflict system middle component
MRAEGLNEADIVQNAALGSALIWRFGRGYQEKTASVPPLLPLAFIVLPVCLYAQTLQEVLSTRRNSGLSVFAAKVGEVRENLLAIQGRALSLRQLSLQSISIGTRAGMLAIDYKNAAIRSNEVKPPAPPERIKASWDAAERMGYWCGGLQLPEISTLLKMDF